MAESGTRERNSCTRRNNNAKRQYAAQKWNAGSRKVEMRRRNSNHRPLPCAKAEAEHVGNDALCKFCSWPALPRAWAFPGRGESQPTAARRPCQGTWERHSAFLQTRSHWTKCLNHDKLQHIQCLSDWGRNDTEHRSHLWQMCSLVRQRSALERGSTASKCMQRWVRPWSTALRCTKA